MIGGLPWTSWLLLLAAAGIGPLVVLLFVRNQLRRRRVEAILRERRRLGEREGSRERER